MAALKVLICGSGIAGSAFASCLLRAYPKANITIVERAPALRLTGAAVDIRNSAVDVIKWMGIEPEIRANGTKESGVQLVDSKGASIATFEATGRTDVQSLTSEYEIMRGTLAKVIITPVLDKVNLVFNETVDTYEQAAEGSSKVLVTFANGRKDTYDLLVAADGLGSRIRGQLLNAPSRDQIHDEGTHVCYFTVKEDLLKGSTIAQGYTATKGRCIFVRPDPNPAGHSSCILMNMTWSSQLAEKQKLNDAVKQGNDAYKKLIREQFQDAGWIAPKILDSMDASDDFYCSLFGQVRSPKLQQSGSNVVLLGDAGYATPGMGTSLALLGGYILAGELLRHPKDINIALKNYEDLMLPFVKQQQGNFPAMQILNPQSAWGITVRNTIFRLVTMAKIDKIAMWATAKLGFTEKMLELPDYEWAKPKSVGSGK